MGRTSEERTYHRCRVLVADDEANVRGALRVALTWTEEAEVIGETSAAESVLASTAEHRPDMILLDWTLPGLDTKNLVAELHRTYPGLLVVALSVRPEARTAALAAGADAFVAKVDGPAELLSTIRRLVTPPPGAPT